MFCMMAIINLIPIEFMYNWISRLYVRGSFILCYQMSDIFLSFFERAGFMCR